MENLNTIKVTIGRGKDNDIIIVSPEISRMHANLTFITANVLLLEDTDSTFGTAVNGQRVARKIIGMDDSVVLAEKETLNLLDIRSRFLVKPTLPPEHKKQSNSVSPPPLDSLDFREEFKKLEKMLELYTQVSEAMIINTPKQQAWLRASFMVVPIALGLFIPGIGLIVGGLGAAVGQIVAAQAINPAEKKLTLDKEFKLNYVCPNPACKRFLGFASYADLLHQKQCSRCKAKWVD